MAQLTPEIDSLNLWDPDTCFSAFQVPRLATFVGQTDRVLQKTATSRISIVATTLHSFPELLLKIRLKIWGIAVLGRRVVTINWRNYRYATISRTPCHNNGLIAEADDVGILRACRDSRRITLKYYQLDFENHLPFPIYPDFSKDILLFRNEVALLAFIDCPGCHDTTFLRDLNVRQLFIEADFKCHSWPHLRASYIAKNGMDDNLADLKPMDSKTITLIHPVPYKVLSITSWIMKPMSNGTGLESLWEIKCFEPKDR
ncbi:hypothetical protein B0J14DRAFT_555942 [Halenospora varia]|nr:hypothetical protein B0J14DRAFT_555942 [Halenospora varia]